MKYAIALVLSAFLPATAGADEPLKTAAPLASESEVTVAVEANLSDFIWLKRPIVVFADTDADPRFKRQMELLAARPDALTERDVVILTDTDPNTPSDIRNKLRPRGFMMVLIGKDGGVKLRKPFPWDVRELSHAIDKMPLRRQELKEKRAAALQE